MCAVLCVWAPRRLTGRASARIRVCTYPRVVARIDAPLCGAHTGFHEEKGTDEMAHEQHTAQGGDREHFRSRLGFIMVAAGCAIGLGNVWRFPYITGEYGGAAFIVLYLVALVIMGLPVMIMEFAVGRASQRSVARAFHVLPSGKSFKWFSWVGIIGQFVLLMFYTTVCGWMIAYIFKFAGGAFTNVDASVTEQTFAAMTASPSEMVAWMLVSVAIAVAVCAIGLQKGVERVTKVMMLALFAIMLVLVVRAVTLPGAGDGLSFYLMPDFSHLFAGDTPAEQLSSFGNAAFAAMGQAFFTLSVGMGSMEIFGSRIGRERSLTGEAVTTVILDTCVAVMAGLIIFPCCFAYGVDPTSGPSLVFQTLPVVLGQMPLGTLWGALFFVFMSFAALSTVIAVFESNVSWVMDRWDWSRKKGVVVCGGLLAVLSLPCALGFNVLSGAVVPGIGDIQSVEDFIISNNILPLGGLVFVVFCTRKLGWGWENFLAEADAGRGLKFPAWAKLWCAWGIPVLIAIIWVMGWVPIVTSWLGLG